MTTPVVSDTFCFDAARVMLVSRYICESAINPVQSQLQTHFDRVYYHYLPGYNNSAGMLFSSFNPAAVQYEMNIDTSLKPLGEIDVEPLRKAILDLDEAAWHSNEQRQTDYEVHKQTNSIILVFCDGPMHDLVVSKQGGWDLLAESAIPIMHELINRAYPPGGTIIRAMAAKLLSRGRIAPHFDSHPTFRQSHRIHVPITDKSPGAFHD